MFILVAASLGMCRSSSRWCRWSPNKSLEKIVFHPEVWEVDDFFHHKKVTCEDGQVVFLLTYFNDNLIYINEMPCFFLTFNPDVYFSWINIILSLCFYLCLPKCSRCFWKPMFSLPDLSVPVPWFCSPAQTNARIHPYGAMAAVATGAVDTEIAGLMTRAYEIPLGFPS